MKFVTYLQIELTIQYLFIPKFRRERSPRTQILFIYLLALDTNKLYKSKFNESNHQPHLKVYNFSIALKRRADNFIGIRFKITNLLSNKNKYVTTNTSTIKDLSKMFLTTFS